MMKGAKPTVFVGVDVMKLLCALLIVYLHTYNYDWGVIGDWVHINLASIGVPFFFIVSGYIMYYALKWKRKHLMYIFSLLFFILGVLYNGGYK